MGIKGLYKYIESKQPQCITRVKLSELCDNDIHTIAIDTSISAYKFFYNGCLYSGFIRQILGFRKAKLTPIYIFDGTPPCEKNDVLEERSIGYENVALEYDKTEKDVDELTNLLKECQLGNRSDVNILKTVCELNNLKEQLKKLSQRSKRPTHEHYQLLQEMFDLVGVPYINAIAEAEWLCCALVNSKLVDAVYSDDSDAFLNIKGCGKVLSKWNLRDNSINIYDIKVLLDEMGVSHNQLIDIGIMAGCDYTSGISGVGIVKGISLIKKYGTIEEIVTNGGIAVDEDFLGIFQEARDLFCMFPDDLSLLEINTYGGNFDKDHFVNNSIQEDSLRIFLTNHTQMSAKTINELIIEIIKSTF